MTRYYKAVRFYAAVLLWGFFLTGLIVHLFFPYQKALKIAFQNVVGGSKMAVSMDGVRVVPTGVRIKKALIGHEVVQGRPIVELSDVKINWHPLSLLSGNFSVSSRASAYSGTLECDVLGIPVIGSKNPSMTVRFRNINLAKYPTGTLPWFKGISGTADGAVTREVALLHPIKEKGVFKLSIKNGEVRDLHTQNLQGLILPFKEIRAEGRLNGSQAIIDKAFLSGSSITMKGSGTLVKGDGQPVINLKLAYESRSTAIPLPSKGAIVMSGNQWSPTVTISAETQNVEAEKKQP
ncbi:MAG TPA: type II secretion system protein GspN [Deltaproteobacteria bacterium]|nr:type II secretion system protein GspN [Deltaproteobacteria bacterium]